MEDGSNQGGSNSAMHTKPKRQKVKSTFPAPLPVESKTRTQPDPDTSHTSLDQIVFVCLQLVVRVLVLGDVGGLHVKRP